MSYRRGNNANFDNLAPVPPPVSERSYGPGLGHNYKLHGNSHLLLWFIIIAVIAWILLWIWKPAALQNTSPTGVPTGEANGWKTLLAAIIIALIIVLLIWLFRANR
jgi:cellobiose-specific phosphotransferase system component IIC